MQGGGNMRYCLVSRAIPVLRKTIMTALLLMGAAAGVVAREAKPVADAGTNGTRLQATFPPPGALRGSVGLVYGGSTTGTVIPRAVSADGGRYAQGDLEFGMMGRGGTLT